MDAQGLNYYERLGVAEDATQETIKAAHRELVKQLHPDGRSGPYNSTFDQLLAGVNEAYDVLKKPASRAKYDQRLRYEREREAGQKEQKKQEEARQRQRQHEQQQRTQREQKERQEEERRRREEQQRQEREEEQRRRAVEGDDEEYYWQEPGDREEPRRASSRPAAGPALWWRIYSSAQYVQWSPIIRLVGLVVAPLVVLYVLWSMAASAFDSFESSTRAAAQDRAAREETQAPAISEADRKAAEEELGRYYDAFACSSCSADALVAAVDERVAPEWWESPAGRELQRTADKMARDKELRQSYQLDSYTPEKPGLLSGRDRENEIKGTAYYSGRSTLGNNDSGPVKERQEIRMRRTEAGGWTIIYAGSGRDR